MERIIDGVYRLGSRWVNFFLVEEAGALTLVDTGFPGYEDQLSVGLREIGRAASDIKAIVLTHTHGDHIGSAPAYADLSGAPVLVHEAEAEIATGKEKAGHPDGVVSSLWRPSMLAFVGHAARNKGMKLVTVPKVTSYSDDEVLDVPGKLRVVHTPGHSKGHSALLFEGRQVLFCGDAMATFAVNTGRRGPMLHPFNEDRDRASSSLDVLKAIDANVLLSGHGEPWRGSLAEAVETARSTR